MFINASIDSAILVTKNPLVRGALRLERGIAPLVCRDSISAAAVYQTRYKDAKTIFVDVDLLIPGSAKVVEEILGSIKPKAHIVYLTTTLRALSKAGLSHHQHFKLLEITE
jgi:hypothetical protein